MTTPPMLRQLRHDVWATEKLIAHCRTLTDAQLDLTAPGTYGTIRRTLQHIVGADTRYLARIGAPVVDMPFPQDRDVLLDQTAATLEKVKAAVERIFSGVEFEADRVVVDPFTAPSDPAMELEAWMMPAQFVHHGSDHRAHIGTILGVHGIEGPDLDVWAYGREIGAIRRKR